MTLETYLLFVGASLALVLSPGPDLFYMLGRCVAQGRRAGIVAALGINAGAYVHLAASITGLSAILLTSAVAFAVVKWIGAAYLVYLGVRAILGKEAAFAALGEASRRAGLRSVFWQGFLSDALNPKVAIFYLAFLPQFVDVEAGDVVRQLLLLGLTVNMVAIVVNLGIVAASARVTQGLRDSPRATRWLQRSMGVVFIGLGARLATETR